MPRRKPEQSYPQKLRVFGKDWELRWQDMDDCSGKTTHRHLLIEVDPDYPRPFLQDTLLHEILHAVDEELHLELEERQVHQMATALLSVMNDNPAIRRFLFGDDDGGFRPEEVAGAKRRQRG